MGKFNKIFMVIASSKNAKMHPIIFYFQQYINEHRIPMIQSPDGGTYESIIVKPDHRPCSAFFNRSGEIMLWSPDGSEINTGLNRDEFPDCGAERLDDCDAKYGADYFIVLLSCEKLESLGFRVETGDGWKWDHHNLESINVVSSSKMAWCPVTESWEKPCECDHCQETGQSPTYVDFAIIKDIYKMLPYGLITGNLFAELANKCPFDRVNNCDECGASCCCEKSCSKYDPFW